MYNRSFKDATLNANYFFEKSHQDGHEFRNARSSKDKSLKKGFLKYPLEEELLKSLNFVD